VTKLPLVQNCVTDHIKIKQFGLLGAKVTHQSPEQMLTYQNLVTIIYKI